MTRKQKIESEQQYRCSQNPRGVIGVAKTNRNPLSVPGATDAVENMKEEIARDFNVEPGADTTARENGSVGGEMVKRMIQIAEQNMQNGDQ